MHRETTSRALEDTKMAKMRIDGHDIRDVNIYETIFENFPDIIHSVDCDGIIVFTNQRAQDLLGYSRDQLIGMNIRTIYADEVLEKVEEGFHQLKQEGDRPVIESILKDKDGNLIPVEIRSFSIYDDEGNFLRTLSIIRDIREIKELQNSLIHAGRLAAIGELASGIAHDINNPLAVLLLANEVALLTIDKCEDAKTELVEQLEKALQDIGRASRVIQKLADHLRNFSRGTVEKHEPVNVAEILGDALFITQNKTIKSKTTIINEVGTTGYYTNGAPNQLEQVFVNLIANACDAMMDSENPQLTIAINPETRDNIEYWHCSIADTGAGIPEHIREHIFESFFTTKEKGKGTGLGLSICRGIIDNHEGIIEVKSELGNGTTFSVLLIKSEPGQPPKEVDDPSN